MSKVNYYLKGVLSTVKMKVLKSENSKEYLKQMEIPRQIILSIASGGRRETFSTGKTISLKNWNKQTMSIKLGVDLPLRSQEDKIWLESKKVEIEKYLFKQKSAHLNWKRDDINSILERDVFIRRSDSESLIKKLDIFLAEHKTHKGVPIKENTAKKFRTLVNIHWIGFENGSERYTPQRYSYEWVEEFRQFLFNSGCTDNTVCKYIEGLKTFFKFFLSKGDFINIDLAKIKTYEYEQVINILENNELKRLEDWEFYNKYHDRVRDIFLFQCYTGARYSDIEKISHDEIHAEGSQSCWTYVAKKTNDLQIDVPLHLRARRILEKYSALDTPLPRLTNQTMNETIKVIAEELGLNRQVKRVTYKNGVLSESYSPLYEIISTHMARKTYISLSLQMGVPAQFVKAISGHRDDKSFNRYVNLAKSHLMPVAQAWDSIHSKNL